MQVEIFAASRPTQAADRQLRTPRAAAVAGILFSVLLFATFGLMRLSVPGDPFEPGAWLIYLVKTASVFMITTSTIALYTRLTPRWLAVAGYVIAVVLLFGSDYLDWSLMVFPLWVLVVSLSILSDRETAPGSPARS